MPRFVAIAFYRKGDAGWSEVYPINGSSYTGVFTLLDQLNTLRLNMAAPDVQAVGNRISDTDILRDSYSQAFTTPLGTITTAPGTSGDADDTRRIKFFAGPLQRTIRQLHALPGVFFANGIFVPPGSWTTALNAWIASVVLNVSISHKIPGAVVPPFYTYSSITSGSDQGNSNRKVGRPFSLPRGRRLIA